MFLEEAVPIRASLAQTAERGLGKFGELCWEPVLAGKVGRNGERFLALLSACVGPTVELLFTLSEPPVFLFKNRDS